MSYVSTQQVRFAHVDAAGIVFYPRYFEMLNAAVEDYFSAVIGIDFATMHLSRRIGVPTVRIEADFSAVSRLGDRLEFTLRPIRVGRSSAQFDFAATCAEQTRFAGRATLVCMALDEQRALPWPDDLRPLGDIVLA